MPASDKKSSEPILVNLGKARTKEIKALRRGEGKLMDKVQKVIAEVESQMGDELADKTIVPLIVLYSKKTKKSRSGIFKKLLDV